MHNRLTPVEKMLALSLTFTLSLIAFRMALYGNMGFVYFGWNLFLAVVPVVFSRILVKFNKINFKGILVLCGWLLFLPNAPYLITDIIHFSERPPVSKWFDLLLITSAAWNGLILGVVSLMQVENFLQQHIAKWKLNIIMFAAIFICSFGIYLGRFERYNSWDVVTDPFELIHQIGSQVLRPQHHANTWGFTVLFGAMLWIFYYTIKKLPTLLKPA